MSASDCVSSSRFNSDQIKKDGSFTDMSASAKTNMLACTGGSCTNIVDAIIQFQGDKNILLNRMWHTTCSDNNKHKHTGNKQTWLEKTAGSGSAIAANKIKQHAVK